MTETADILTLAQWFSPAFPIGAFAYSHGLEWSIERGDVSCATSLQNWIADVLRYGSGNSDALFITASFRSRDEVEAQSIDEMCRAYCASKERLQETRHQGFAFSTAIGSAWDSPTEPLTLPVAVGRAAKAQDLPLHATLALYLQAYVSNLVSVGMRLIPIGQSAGQRMIHDFAPACIEIARDAEAGSLEHLTSTAFLADIASMKHESHISRVFRT